jgi:hypothetical protein
MPATRELPAVHGNSLLSLMAVPLIYSGYSPAELKNESFEPAYSTPSSEGKVNNLVSPTCTILHYTIREGNIWCQFLQRVLLIKDPVSAPPT